MTWETLYDFFHIKDFIYFISSYQLQEVLLPVKVVFILCSIFFLVMLIYLMINSTWLQWKFMEDVADFFSWQSYGQREMKKQWDKIKKRIESGSEADYKLAIIDADDFLIDVLEEGGYDGKDFEESIKKAGRLVGSSMDDILKAHEVRNSIVYNPDFDLTVDQAKKILATYEAAAKSIGI
jgi:hypothetical protein